jgi:hypothetical protein
MASKSSGEVFDAYARKAWRQTSPRFVDHPKLAHQWLWDIFGSKIRKNVEIEQEFDETEDLPPPPARQEILRPQLIIEVPKEIPGLVDDEDFKVDTTEVAEPIKNWAEVLREILYESTAIEITRVEIEAVLGKELAGEHWRTIHSAPDLPVAGDGSILELPDAVLRDAIQSTLLEYAEDLAVLAGYAASFKADVYSALLRHVREKFLGTSIGLADRRELLYAVKMLPAVRRAIVSIPGLVAGIIEYADQ